MSIINAKEVSFGMNLILDIYRYLGDMEGSRSFVGDHGCLLCVFRFVSTRFCFQNHSSMLPAVENLKHKFLHVHSVQTNARLADLFLSNQLDFPGVLEVFLLFSGGFEISGCFF